MLRSALPASLKIESPLTGILDLALYLVHSCCFTVEAIVDAILIFDLGVLTLLMSESKPYLIVIVPPLYDN